MLPYLTAISKRYLYHLSDLEDALQDSFVNIFKYLNHYDPKKSAFKTWATRIAINTCVRYNNENRKHKMESLKSIINPQSIKNTALDTLTNEELMAWLKTMPNQYFEVFNMYIIDGYPHEEIAETLGIKIALSRKRLSRARAWIAKYQDENKVLRAFT